jgi:hypothetical protein
MYRDVKKDTIKIISTLRLRTVIKDEMGIGGKFTKIPQILTNSFLQQNYCWEGIEKRRQKKERSRKHVRSKHDVKNAG